MSVPLGSNGSVAATARRLTAPARPPVAAVAASPSTRGPVRRPSGRRWSPAAVTPGRRAARPARPRRAGRPATRRRAEERPPSGATGPHGHDVARSATSDLTTTGVASGATSSGGACSVAGAGAWVGGTAVGGVGAWARGRRGRRARGCAGRHRRRRLAGGGDGTAAAGGGDASGGVRGTRHGLGARRQTGGNAGRGRRRGRGGRRRAGHRAGGARRADRQGGDRPCDRRATGPVGRSVVDATTAGAASASSSTPPPTATAALRARRVIPVPPDPRTSAPSADTAWRTSRPPAARTPFPSSAFPAGICSVGSACRSAVTRCLPNVPARPIVGMYRFDTSRGASSAVARRPRPSAGRRRDHRGEAQRRARVRRARAAQRVPHARLRAAQAPQRRPGHLPRHLVRLALPVPEGLRVPRLDRRGGARPTPAPPHCRASGRGSSTSSPPRARNGSRRCWPRAAPRPGRTTGSASTSPSSAGPTRRCGGASSKGGAAGWRSARPACVPPWRAPGSGSTRTPSNCSATASTPSSARCAGSTACSANETSEPGSGRSPEPTDSRPGRMPAAGQDRASDAGPSGDAGHGRHRPAAREAARKDS